MKLIKKWLGITKVEAMTEYLRKSMLNSYVTEVSSIKRIEILEDRCTILQAQYVHLYNEVNELKKGKP